MRRFTSLTNALSEKFEKHMHMVALYTVWYSFVGIHKSLRVTPALSVGMTGRVWDMADFVASIDANAPKPGPRGSHRRGGADGNN